MLCITAQAHTKLHRVRYLTCERIIKLVMANCIFIWIYTYIMSVNKSYVTVGLYAHLILCTS